MAGALYLIPATLGSEAVDAVIPRAVQERIRGIGYFIAENPRTARAYLKRVDPDRAVQSIVIERLDHNTPAQRVDALLAPVAAGIDAGLLSEAGCPAVADPGSPLVLRAHESGIRVVPLAGPSSVLLALIASGLQSQRFAFHGYLPVKTAARAVAIRDLEARSRRLDETQIFIEAPYRNLHLFDSLVAVCGKETLLCVAAELAQPNEWIRTYRIRDWVRRRPALNDRPAVFLLLAPRVEVGRRRSKVRSG